MDLGSATNGNVTVTNRYTDVAKPVVINSCYIYRQEAVALQEHCAQTCTAMYR